MQSHRDTIKVTQAHKHAQAYTHVVVHHLPAGTHIPWHVPTLKHTTQVLFLPEIQGCRPFLSNFQFFYLVPLKYFLILPSKNEEEQMGNPVRPWGIAT